MGKEEERGGRICEKHEGEAKGRKMNREMRRKRSDRREE